MLTLVVIVGLVVVMGTRAADGLRVRQQEVILRNLPEGEARAYYNVLRGRVRRQMVLRVVALLSLFALSYCYRYRVTAPRPPAASSASARS